MLNTPGCVNISKKADFFLVTVLLELRSRSCGIHSRQSRLNFRSLAQRCFLPFNKQRRDPGNIRSNPFYGFTNPIRRTRGEDLRLILLWERSICNCSIFGNWKHICRCILVIIFASCVWTLLEKILEAQTYKTCCPGPQGDCSWLLDYLRLAGVLEVELWFDGIWFDGFFSGLPVGWTCFPVCVWILESFDQTQDFVNWSAYS